MAIKYLSKTLCKVRQILHFICYSKVEYVFRFGAILHQTEQVRGKVKRNERRILNESELCYELS